MSAAAELPSSWMMYIFSSHANASWHCLWAAELFDDVPLWVSCLICPLKLYYIILLAAEPMHDWFLDTENSQGFSCSLCCLSDPNLVHPGLCWECSVSGELMKGETPKQTSCRQPETFTSRFVLKCRHILIYCMSHGFYSIYRQPLPLPPNQIRQWLKHQLLFDVKWHDIDKLNLPRNSDLH